MNERAQQWVIAIGVIVVIIVFLVASDPVVMENLTDGKAEELLHGRGSGGTAPGCYDSDADGQTTCAGDCNDRDRTIFRGAVEYCGNNVDEDCTGGANACVATVSIEATKNNYTQEEVELN